MAAKRTAAVFRPTLWHSSSPLTLSTPSPSLSLLSRRQLTTTPSPSAAAAASSSSSSAYSSASSSSSTTTTTSSSSSTSSSPSIHSIYATPSPTSASTTTGPSRVSPLSSAHSHPYHIHVYAHKHNTHITFTSPAFNPILSLSCGSIGLRKAQRSSFDAAFNLSAFFFRRLATAQWRDGGKKMGNRSPLKTIRDVQTRSEGEGVEVILRGYGPGREAFQKALLGQDGAVVRGLVWKVTDATRLKFGGVRSPAVRRLG